MSHYGFDQFAAELEHQVPRSLHQHDLIAKILPAMQKLLSNESLLSSDFVSAIRDGHHDGRVYTSPDHGFFVQVFAWPPGAKTGVHDHNTWGMMGIYHNVLHIHDYHVYPQQDGTYELGSKHEFDAGSGMIASVTYPDDEIHSVANPSEEYSYSIHIYGAELGQTHYYDFESKRFYQSA